MEWVILIVGGVALLALVLLYGLWQAATTREAMAKAALLQEQTARVAAEKAAALADTAYTDRVARLAAVNTALKQELVNLEDDLSRCSSPDDVRTRLRQLLSSPAAVPTDRAAADATVALPGPGRVPAKP